MSGRTVSQPLEIHSRSISSASRKACAPAPGPHTGPCGSQSHWPAPFWVTQVLTPASPVPFVVIDLSLASGRHWHGTGGRRGRKQGFSHLLLPQRPRLGLCCGSGYLRGLLRQPQPGPLTGSAPRCSPFFSGKMSVEVDSPCLAASFTVVRSKQLTHLETDTLKLNAMELEPSRFPCHKSKQGCVASPQTGH